MRNIFIKYSFRTNKINYNMYIYEYCYKSREYLILQRRNNGECRSPRFSASRADGCFCQDCTQVPSRVF